MRLAALFLAALALPPTAAAQTGTLVPGRDSSSMVEEWGRLRRIDPKQQKAAAAQRRANAEANETMRSFASCLINSTDTRREHDALVAFLRVQPDAPQAAELAGRFTKDECLNAGSFTSLGVRFSADVLRGALFRSLYLDANRAPGRPRVERAELEPVWSKADGNYAALVRFGDCVVADQPAAAHTFVAVRPDSTEQGAAVQMLSPSLNKCVGKGATVQFSRMMLESTLSEALYRQATRGVA